MGTIQVLGAAIAQAGRCLIAQRGPRQSLAGKWEFPGGKVEAGELAPAALAREIVEELGLTVEVGVLLGSGQAHASNTLIQLEVYAAFIIGGALALHEHAQVVWARPEELGDFDWADADVPIVAPVRAWLQSSDHST